MTASLVTVATYADAADAAVARDALTAADIEAAAIDTRVKVRTQDAIRASAILVRDCAGLQMIEEADEPDVDPTLCTTCGSSDGVRSARALLFVLIVLVGIGIGAAAATAMSQAVFFGVAAIGIYLLISDRWRCPECGASWN